MAITDNQVDQNLDLALFSQDGENVNYRIIPGGDLLSVTPTAYAGPNYYTKGYQGNSLIDTVMVVGEANHNIEMFINDITVEMCLDKVPMVTINANNNEFVLTDNNSFIEGVIYDIQVGYGYHYGLLGRFTPVRWMPKFPQNSMPKITIQLYGLELFFMRHKGPQKFVLGAGNAGQWTDEGNPWSFTAKKASDVVAEILSQGVYSQLGFTLDIEETDVEHSWLQKQNSTDWQFLKELALFHGFEVGLEYTDLETTFYFRSIEKSQMNNNLNNASVIQYSYQDKIQGEILSFNPVWGVSSTPSGVKVPYVDKDGKIQTKTFSINQTEEPKKPNKKSEKITYGPTAYVSAFGNQIISVPLQGSYKPEKMAAAVAKSLLQKYIHKSFHGAGEFVGHHFWKPGQIWEFTGCGNLLSRTYRLHTVRHHIGKGRPYYCDFECHLPIEGILES